MAVPAFNPTTLVPRLSPALPPITPTSLLRVKITCPRKHAQPLSSALPRPRQSQPTPSSTTHSPVPRPKIARVWKARGRPLLTNRLLGWMLARPSRGCGLEPSLQGLRVVCRSSARVDKRSWLPSASVPASSCELRMERDPIEWTRLRIRLPSSVSTCRMHRRMSC